MEVLEMARRPSEAVDWVAVAFVICCDQGKQDRYINDCSWPY